MSEFLTAAVEGLTASPKHLACKYFYDERGSALFDQICELEEYYLTRTELAIMEQYASEMGEQIGEGVMLVEYGSGSSVKTRILLDNLPNPVAYVPVDISGEHLEGVAVQLRQDYPHIEILPVCADFTRDFTLPKSTRPATHAAVYFPGSTIGNFEPQAAEALLSKIAPLCGTGGGLLIGIDLEKDADVLEAAYDDEPGVTASFNLNLLHRLKNELNAEIDLDGFEHEVIYNPDVSRIEIYIRSLQDQAIVLDGQRFQLSAGERIHTEYSHKHSIAGFAEIAARAGLTLHRTWTDPQQYFAVLHFAVEN